MLVRCTTSLLVSNYSIYIADQLGDLHTSHTIQEKVCHKFTIIYSNERWFEKIIFLRNIKTRQRSHILCSSATSMAYAEV